MVYRFEELRCKEIINIKTGRKLGYPDDVEFDTCTAKICKIIVYGRLKCFGIFGREDDFAINWCDIDVIGEDTILVSCNFPDCTKRKSGTFKNLFK